MVLLYRVIGMAVQNMGVSSHVDAQGIQGALSFAFWRLLLAPADEKDGLLKKIKDLLEPEADSDS